MHFTPTILLNAHWLLLGYLWVVCLLSGVILPYTRDRTTYRWDIGSVMLLIIGVLALVAWILGLLGFISV